MLHNQVAINVSAAIQAKGTAKSNARLNFFSTNLMVRVNIDLMCRKWRAKEISCRVMVHEQLPVIISTLIKDNMYLQEQCRAKKHCHWIYSTLM